MTIANKLYLKNMYCYVYLCIISLYHSTKNSSKTKQNQNKQEMFNIQYTLSKKGKQNIRKKTRNYKIKRLGIRQYWIFNLATYKYSTKQKVNFVNGQPLLNFQTHST